VQVTSNRHESHITITVAVDYSSVAVSIRWRRTSIGQWQICNVCHSIQTLGHTSHLVGSDQLL